MIKILGIFYFKYFKFEGKHKTKLIYLKKMQLQVFYYYAKKYTYTTT